MKILLNVTIDRLEDKINRQILIDEKIELADMGKYIIISMKDHKIPFYRLENINMKKILHLKISLIL